MDILAHGLWTAVIYNRTKFKLRLWAVLFGIAPDLLSFGWIFVDSIFSRGFNFGPPDINNIPAALFVTYNIWHSLFVWLFIFGIVWLILKRPWWPLAGSLLHIAIDVPLHDANFKPTPWLWPVSNYTVNGYSWAHPVFMLVNYSLLVTIYIIWFIGRWRKSQL